jgi:hypothetical protein
VTQEQAKASAARLKTAMLDWGVRCSIELRAGRGSDPWGVYTKYHRMHHHTAATPYKPGGNLTPSLFICKNGRSDVPGPLCNGYGGYDLVYRIICMGEANHPGLGGPITIDGVRIPQNSARKPTWGTEWEGGFQSWEEIDRLGPDMLQFMGRADCALAEWSNRPLTSQLEHKTWAPDRKVDRKDFDAARTRGIALTKKWFALGDDDDMTPAECEAVVRKVLNEGTGFGQANWANTSKAQLRVPQQNANKLNAVLAALKEQGVDIDAILADVSDEEPAPGG